MMSAAAGLSVHVVDIARGVPAAGMRIDLFSVGPGDALEPVFKDRRLDPEGKTAPDNATLAGLIPGRFELRFHVGDYYRPTAGGPSPFIDVLPFRFGIDDADRHHHLPAKITPWGLSLFLTR